MNRVACLVQHMAAFRVSTLDPPNAHRRIAFCLSFEIAATLNFARNLSAPTFSREGYLFGLFVCLQRFECRAEIGKRLDVGRCLGVQVVLKAWRTPVQQPCSNSGWAGDPERRSGHRWGGDHPRAEEAKSLSWDKTFRGQDAPRRARV